MSIDKDLLDRLMEGRSAVDLFGRDGVPAELTKALAERALRGPSAMPLHELREVQA
jgi:putative transposase